MWEAGYLQSLGPLIAASVAVGVAFMQWYLQRQQQKQNLFEKRFQVYSAVKRLLSGVSTAPGALDNMEYDKFLSESRPAKFLFGSDVTNFISEIMGSISHEDHLVAGTYGNYVRYVEPNDPDNEGDPLATFMKWGLRAEVVFFPYLTLHYDQSWIRRFIASANRWMESRCNILDSRYES